MDFRRSDSTYLHDPLAVLALIDRGLVRTTPMHVGVELIGQQTAGATVVRPPTAERPANVQVCQAVDAERAVALFLQRVTG
jgi:purine nucleosidase